MELAFTVDAVLSYVHFKRAMQWEGCEEAEAHKIVMSI